MTPELDSKLCEKYPLIMTERRLGAMETAMCWGFDHGDGWYYLLDSAMHLVQSHIDMLNKRGYTVEQVVFESISTCDCLCTDIDFDGS